MAKNRILYLIAVIALVLLYIYCDSYFPIVLLVMILVLPVMTSLLAFFQRGRVEVRVEPVLKSVIKGTDFKVRVILNNTSYLPVIAVRIRLECSEIYDNSLFKRKIISSLGANEEKSIIITAKSKHCTVSNFTIKQAVYSDAVGLVNFKAKLEKSNTQVLVMPYISDEASDFKPNSNENIDSDVYSEIHKGDDSSQVFEVRNYVLGDDVRRIHWRLSSKQDNLVVKEFSKPIAQSSTIILETVVTDDEQYRDRIDNLSACLLSVATSLLSGEQKLLVYMYSHSRKCGFFTEIAETDEVFDLLKIALSECFCKDKSSSLLCYMDGQTVEDGTVYYIYESSCCNSDITDKYSDRLVLIDAGQVNKLDE